MLVALVVDGAWVLLVIESVLEYEWIVVVDSVEAFVEVLVVDSAARASDSHDLSAGSKLGEGYPDRLVMV